ncbi:MAG: hypothetical protein SWK76_10420 [Actinomycetota bacterium]|nr:hypothetical protein [Actinomycetota bacterium]
MRAVFVLPALPAAAALAGLVFLAGWRFRRARFPALGWALLSLPTLAVLAYRFWDHHVGPEGFSWWMFELTPGNMSMIVPLAALSPLLLLAAEGKGMDTGRENVASALSCLALASAMTAVLSRHLFITACMFALATLSMAGAALARKGGGRAFLPASLVPVALSDLCLAVGVLFLYLHDPSRGLFLPAAPLRVEGLLIPACALMLAAALLRLGGFPFHRWMSGIARGGKDFRLIHLLAVDLVLGTYLLYSVTRVLFAWDGTWVWICFGVSLLTLVVVLRELLSARDRDEAWGLLCVALGAHVALSASTGSQLGAVACRLGIWVGVAALALVQIGGERGRGRTWALPVGGLCLLGLPPMAGFSWRWMEFNVLAGELAGGAAVLFLAAVPVVFAGAFIEGFTCLWLPARGEAEAPRPWTIFSGVVLAAFLLVLGLYPGKLVDLLMREYGLAVNLPFSSWTPLGWAMLICGVVSMLILAAWTFSGDETRRAAADSRPGALPLLGERRVFGPALVAGSRKSLVAYTACDGLLLAAWAAAMIYLALR